LKNVLAGAGPTSSNKSHNTEGKQTRGSLTLKTFSSDRALGKGKHRRQLQQIYSIPAWLGCPSGKKTVWFSIPWFASRASILVPSIMRNNVTAFQRMKVVQLVMTIACLSTQDKHQGTPL